MKERQTHTNKRRAVSREEANGSLSKGEPFEIARWKQQLNQIERQSQTAKEPSTSWTQLLRGLWIQTLFVWNILGETKLTSLFYLNCYGLLLKGIARTLCWRWEALSAPVTQVVRRQRSTLRLPSSEEPRQLRPSIQRNCWSWLAGAWLEVAARNHCPRLRNFRLVDPKSTQA